MAIGDEINVTEALYQELIGRYVSTIEVLTRRSNLKDQRIAILESAPPENVPEFASGPKEGDMKYEEEISEE